MTTINEEKTPNLRFVAGQLEQQVRIAEYTSGEQTANSFEWKKVPSFETSPDDQGEGETE